MILRDLFSTIILYIMNLVLILNIFVLFIDRLEYVPSIPLSQIPIIKQVNILLPLKKLASKTITIEIYRDKIVN